MFRLPAAVCAVAASLLISSCSSCRRPAEVPEAAYREAVAAFHTAVAALETSQEVLARQKLDRVIELAPQEAAAWANLGLLLLRQQEIGPAKERLSKAAELAPSNAHVRRLLAIAESRAGDPVASIRHWQRALELDKDDVRAPFALAMEIERQGGAEHDAEAQRVFEALLTRHDNLPVRLEAMRLAAKRGDAASLSKGLAALDALSASWPTAAQAQLQALRAVASGNPRLAATRVVFLKNVLVREPAYRRALAEVSTPLDAVGEPIETFLVLRNPPPGAAPPDLALTFAAGPGGPAAAEALWTGVIVPSADASPAIVFAEPRGLRIGDVFVAVPGGLSAPLGPDAIAAADLNYDFRTDLVVAASTGLTVLRQQADGAFTDVTAAAGLPAAASRAPAHAVWTADADTDGDLDLVVGRPGTAPALLRNNGDGTFTESRPFDGVTDVRGFAWGDVDGEGVPDAVLVDAAGRLHVQLNLRGGVFAAERVPDAGGAIAAAAVVELNGDSTLDVLAVAAGGELKALKRDARGTWAWTSLGLPRGDVAPRGTAPGTATRLIAADVDNNGATDAIVSSREGATLMLGRGPGRYAAPANPRLALDVRAAADLNGDGRLELVGLAAGRAAVLASTGRTAYRWQALRPRAATATGDQRINSFGIGGEVEVRSGLHVQKQTIDTPLVHVGLGNAQAADVIRITWPNGVLQSEFERPSNAVVAASQRLKGSCPWLFAWNGREMAFVTDVIWRSPLGLRINAQDTADVATTEDWVKVSGEQLVAREGAYDLRITAELWETHFFDLVSLMAVDHPAGTEVFVDERFAIPAPALRPIVTGPLQPLAAARDDRGRDLADVLAARDDRHADFAGRGAYQGVTRPHYVELELPEAAPRQGPLWLVARGWVHPTDSSVNVALGQGSHPAPRGLSLDVADARGAFRTVRPNLGFPAGKDKTVLVDLDGLLPTAGPRRLRLSTNLEVFWDRIAWAEGRPGVQVTVTPLPLQSAELRYRGYSQTAQRAPGSPERPRYVLAGTAPRWRDLEGYHTRFGDVRELLTGVDDRYVIMNAGDEIALRFAAAPAPAPGAVRDFILAGDGWVKDGDFNTSFSRTVLPLPTHADPGYRTPPRTLEDDPVYQRHRADFETYHTRYVAADRASGALRTGTTTR